MADSLEQSLGTLAQTFTTTVAPGATTYDFALQLISPNPQLTVNHFVTKTVLQNGIIDVLWQSKDVRFPDEIITNNIPIGGMPINGLLGVNVATVTKGNINPPGVPGILGALKGTIPIPVLNTVLQSDPVRTDVKWKVKDEHGNIVSDLEWKVGVVGVGASGVGGEITIPFGGSPFPLNIHFLPLFTELTNSNPINLIVKRTVVCSVRLDTLGISTGWIDLPPIDIFLPVIPVPTIAAFFEHENFTGLSLVLVPSNSPLDPLDINVVTNALDLVNNSISSLKEAGSFLNLFIGELVNIKNILNSINNVTFRKTDEIPNLRDVELESASFWDWNGTVASDEFTSMILIGPPRRQIKCFNDTDFNSGQGQFNLTLGAELLVEVHYLGNMNPSSVPTGKVSVIKPPSGWNWSLARWITKFGDEISSVRFDWG